jgi:hypothetical protein
MMKRGFPWNVPRDSLADAENCTSFSTNKSTFCSPGTSAHACRILHDINNGTSEVPGWLRRNEVENHTTGFSPPARTYLVEPTPHFVGDVLWQIPETRLDYDY